MRYISVALVLRSPSAGVTRYPCPVKPGLSSPGAFRHPAAAVQPGRKAYFTVKRIKSQTKKGEPLALPLRVLINFYIFNAVFQNHVHDLIARAVSFSCKPIQFFQNSFRNPDGYNSITIVTSPFDCYRLFLSSVQRSHLSF